MHTSVIGLIARLHKHIRQSDHGTFTCTCQVLVNVQWPVWLTCACKCEESHKIRSLHILMHTSVIGLTAQFHEYIRQSDHCTFTCTHQVHVNVQWTECLTSPCKCAESDNWLTAQFHAHIGHLANCPITWTHRTVGSLHIYMHTSGACKRAVTRTSDVCR